jgi:DNA helicase-2/ATP-dependent DNA helicase PcrA
MSNKHWEEKYSSRYKNLNERQKEAVDTIDGPVLVVAGPGSGKTELLSIRAANILLQTDCLPANILLLTFTDAGSYNMRERLINLIGQDAYRIGIYTFHSFASDLINKYPEYFFEGARFVAATDVDQINILENILKNLPRKNPLGGYHPELGYIYMRDILSAIRDLKKGGYTPEKFAEKLTTNNKYLKELKNILDSLEDVVGKRKYQEVVGAYTDIYNNLKKIKTNEIAKVLASTLELALKRANDAEKATFLTSWKNAYSQKTESGKFILKDSDPKRIEKLESLLAVYTEYQNSLYNNALYDFEDMIILAVQALQKFPNLKADLQERFQYIMIDEFQDTNDSQLQLVLELSKNNFNLEPNILAVGDDDQAIFKFQGAELNNIYSFLDNFPNSKKVILDKNYRSTQDILDFARAVILKAEDRLETRDQSINKNIKAANSSLIDKKIGEIRVEKFESSLFEYEFIAEEIQRLLSNGVTPKEISIISRKHEQLKQLANIFNNFKIPYKYTKRDNILKLPHIEQLITILKFTHYKNTGDGDELLPEILSYDFWGISRVEIWKIAEQVKRENTSWLETMINSESIKIKEIANFLISLSGKSKSTPLEYLLDEIIGSTGFLWEDSEYDDILLPKENPAKDFTSPYKGYYFSKKTFLEDKTKYLDFLTSLRTFIQALREFHSENVLYAKDIIEFEETYNGNHLSLSSVSEFASGEDCVQLLTAHAAKGLEFEYVFLLTAEQGVWGRGGFPNKISFPVNMPLTPEGDNEDDKIRLLYVALTRAKHTLYITHSSHKVEFLVTEGEEESKANKRLPSKNIISSLELVPKKDFVKDEVHLIKMLLENYKMPVTHLNNFLNIKNFGPDKFIEFCLLRFPQAVSPSAAYGSAMHSAIEKFYLYYKKEGKMEEVKNVKDNFKKYLAKCRLREHDFKKYLESGYENLEIYIADLKKRNLLPNTRVEIRFRSEDVVIGECPITGNIDRMDFVSQDEIIITDLKTGTSYESFDESGLQDYEKIKLHFYKYQLAFYALLVENSKSFHNYRIKVANLEFVECDKNEKIQILPLAIDQEIKDRVVRLANVVCKKIHHLDFPDTSHYPQTMKGILQFEEDLLNGNI